MELFSKLMALMDRISYAHRSIYKELSKDLDLSPLEVRVITLLGYLDRPVNLTYIAESLYMRKPTVVEILDKLEKRGLIRRKRWEEDKRVILVSLTEEGKNLEKKILKALEPLRKVLESISPDLLEKAFQFSFEYLYLLNKYQLIPVLRVCYTCANFIRDEVSGGSRYICKATNTLITFRDMRLDCPLYKKREEVERNGVSSS